MQDPSFYRRCLLHASGNRVAPQSKSVNVNTRT